ncbi:MAG: addiction module protein [Planctomycetota bacterium]
MNATTERIKDELKVLPVEDRAELARFLIESLDDGSDDDAEAAWDAELARRMAEIENGTAVFVPAEEVFAQLRAKYP